MYPVLSNEDFISPKDKAGRDLFYRVTNLTSVPKGSVVFLVGKRATDNQLEAAKVHGLTIQKLNRVPPRIYQEMCYADRAKWHSYVFA